MSDSLRPHGLYSPWNSPGQITAVVASPFSRGSSQPKDRTQVSLIAGGFFTSWATKGSPEILACVTYPFSSGSSQPRNWTGVSCIACGFFTNWASLSRDQTHSPCIGRRILNHWTTSEVLGFYFYCERNFLGGFEQGNRVVWFMSFKSPLGLL